MSKLIPVTVALPMKWWIRGGERASSYKMVPYRPEMLYADDAEDNRKSVVLTLEEVVNQIATNPVAERRCNALRSDIPKEDKAHIKKTGLNRLFWGHFNLEGGKFEDKNIVAHPGVMCFDVDKISEFQAYMCKEILREDPYCVLAFLSPRGQGIKFLIRTPPSIDQHAMRYAGIMARYEKILKFPLDATGSNLSRACFMSYDPDPIINWEAKMCMEFLEEKPTVITPVQLNGEEGDVFKRAVERVTRIKGKDWKDGGKHAFLISLCGTCKAFGLDEITFRSLAADYIIDDSANTSVTKLYKTK
jgi:hypothetical protein